MAGVGVGLGQVRVCTEPLGDEVLEVMGAMGGSGVDATLLNLNHANTVGEAMKSYTRSRTLETIHVKPSNGRKGAQTGRRLCRYEGTELEFRSPVFQSTDSLDCFLGGIERPLQPP